jgi:DNA-binding helix-hairpin-helix protein with protein kinase domain
MRPIRKLLLRLASPRPNPTTQHKRWKAPLSAFKRPREGDPVFLKNGKRAYLASPISSGGEGKIHAILRTPSALAKIYHPSLLKDPGPARLLEAKVAAMCLKKQLATNRAYAWPRYCLYADTGRFIGFGMGSIQGKSLRVVSSRQLLREQLPRWTRLEQCAIALNIVRSLSVLHQNGIIVGDLNPDNVLFCPRSMEVFLVDCDSYQLKSGDRYFLCEGYVGEFTAPELLRTRSALKRPRKIESEYFSIALLLFHLFMFGQHPFARRQHSDPVEQMIKGACPWLNKQLSEAPLGPWNAYWKHLPPVLRKQFQTAFANTRSPAARPSLESWEAALLTCQRELKRTPAKARFPRIK